MKPDPAKVQDMQQASRPVSKEGVRSFLGMAGFNQRFIPEYAKMTAPLRKLLTDKWAWGEEQEMAFDRVRKALKENTVLHSYCIGAKTRIIVDASPDGLGAVLVQRQEGELVPVVYKSR